MKHKSKIFGLLASVLCAAFLSGCGPKEEERVAQENAKIVSTPYVFHGPCLIEIRFSRYTMIIPIAEVRYVAIYGKDVQLRIKGSSGDYSESIETKSDMEAQKVVAELISAFKECGHSSKTALLPNTK